jgi:pimeloyl-ACP methyl ester carboxylesterase
MSRILGRPARRIGTLLLTLLLAATAVMVGAGSSASASTATAPAPARPGGPLPTIVLVHGAFADASGWDAEVAALQRLGYPVIAPPDPLRGLTADADYLRAILATIPGPVVLVGHSYGGAVITNAARGVRNVDALVYLAAFIPDAGTSVATSYDPTAYPGSLLTQDALVVRPVPNPATPTGQDADLTIKPELFQQIFVGDQNPRTAAVMAATQRPLSLYAYTEPSGEPAWKNIPSWDLITLDDKAISPAGQQFMAHRAGAKIATVHSAHDAMISHPQAVVDIIVRAARATAGN